jgi:hypothetical protein
MAPSLRIPRMTSRSCLDALENVSLSHPLRIGYDAAVCVGSTEPYVVDAYNATTGRVQTFRVIGKGGLSTLRYDYGKDIGSRVDGLDSTLNSTGKFSAFGTAVDNSRNMILKVA